MCGGSLSFLCDPPQSDISTPKWYIVVDHPCVELFEACPKFDCTIREGTIFFINVVTSKWQSYQN